MDKTAIITGIRKEMDHRQTKTWLRVYSVELDTEEGPLTLQITDQAAVSLGALFSGLPSALGKQPGLREVKR